MLSVGDGELFRGSGRRMHVGWALRFRRRPTVLHPRLHSNITTIQQETIPDEVKRFIAEIDGGKISTR